MQYNEHYPSISGDGLSILVENKWNIKLERFSGEGKA